MHAVQSEYLRIRVDSPLKVLLISAATPDTFWSFKYALPFISRKAAFPPLGLLTVAAMLPKDWSLRLVDLNVRNLSDADIQWADYVFISAMLVQADSAREAVRRCGVQGKRVVAGGPLFTAGYTDFPEVKHFVLGEAENVIDELIADMLAGSVKAIYQCPERPDLARTPSPRWDLVDQNQYAFMPLQFSRGCPFNCEFCDIIIMNGRVPRAKAPEQMIRELDSLINSGWDRTIFIVDDNFIGNRTMTKSFLRELVAWREKRDIKVTFVAELSLNLVDDSELINLMIRAGFKKLFVGIETPEKQSLLECEKVHNMKHDMLESVKTLQRAGFDVMGGFIVGFDNDPADIFEQQTRFIQEAGITTAMIGLLTALPGTRLFSRLKEEGRLLCQSTGNNTDGCLNFVPTLDRTALINGYKSLVRYLYAPEAYYGRARTFLREYQPQGPRSPIAPCELRALLRCMWQLGVRERGRMEYWKFLARTLFDNPRAFPEAIGLAIAGYHFRRIALKI